MARIRRENRPLAGLALLAAVLEGINALLVETPAAEVGIAALFLLAWFRIMQGSADGVVLAGALFVFELVGLVFVDRDDAKDWIIQSAITVVAIAGLVVTATVLRRPPLTPPGR